MSNSTPSQSQHHTLLTQTSATSCSSREQGARHSLGVPTDSPSSARPSANTCVLKVNQDTVANAVPQTEWPLFPAMHALSIPTTRSLSLISLPALSVQRERAETACVLTRIAPSFIRIGSFEALNGPTNMHFFGGGQQKPHWDALRVLGEWVTTRVLRIDAGAREGGAWGKNLVLEVARRNAKMAAGWQAYGFMHGVMNTDKLVALIRVFTVVLMMSYSISILGLTIDYGKSLILAPRMCLTRAPVRPRPVQFHGCL